MELTESNCVSLYQLLDHALQLYTDAVEVKNLKRYFIPLCQQDDEAPSVPKGQFIKSDRISRRKMMRQFARSLQNSSAMVGLIKFDKKTKTDSGGFKYKYRELLSDLTHGFDPDYIFDLCTESGEGQPYVPLFNGLKTIYPKNQ